MAVAGAVAGCMPLQGEQVGSAMKVQRPRVTAYAWVEVVAAAVQKRRTSVVVGTPVSAPKVRKIVAGGMAVVKL
jgi:hypothetical protein